MPKNLTFIIFVVMVFLTSIVQAQVSDMTVAVNGMSCPFCAYGVEKRLKKVKGVKKVTVDMQTGSAKIVAKLNLSIHYQEVPKAVKEAGFTAGEMTMTVSGSIEKDNNSFYILFDGPKLLLESGSQQMTARFSDLVVTGKSVILHGGVRKQNSSGWSLLPDSILENGQ